MKVKRHKKFFAQNFGKIALCGVVGSERQKRNKSRFSDGILNERTQKGLGFSQQEKCGAFYGKGTPFLCLLRKKQAANGYSFAVLATYSKQGKDGKRMERKQEAEYNDLLPKKGNPLNETVIYKVGGTLYEVSTVCGGSELLYDKMKRLIKAETVKTPTDKEKKVRYNKDNNLFVGRSLQRNEQ